MNSEIALINQRENDKSTALDNESFRLTLKNHGLSLVRDKTTTLQINVGLICNQACKHCHLSAGPDRTETMDRNTAEQVVAYAKRGGFDIVDITGGAPELNEQLPFLVSELSSFVPRLMVRSNLTALTDGTKDDLMDLFKDKQVILFVSFPSINGAQTDGQRGSGIFNTSIDALKKLNALGYGKIGTGLELNLISNPTGTFLPSGQTKTEDRFRQVLGQKWGIEFTNLFNFANVPLGRFRNWLKKSGNYYTYMQKLFSKFNPCATDSVMCRNQVSVSWDGFLYDCDFNLSQGLGMNGNKTHIKDMPGPPESGQPINVANHCYACTAGAGFT